MAEKGYRRTVRGAVGAGVSSLLIGGGRRYCVLEHRDASLFHRVGESQKIIIDEVLLGRDAACQVRFDDACATVSRRHAAMVRDGSGGGWKIVPLSRTNSTLLNGRSIRTEHRLESGDEIQLSIGGPRMRFVIPEGRQSLVAGIRMTERLDLFRRQALRPYKTALMCLFVFLVAACIGGGCFITMQSGRVKSLHERVERQHEMFAGAQEKYRRDSAAWADRMKKQGDTAGRSTVSVSPGDAVTREIERAKASVYAIVTTVYCEDADGKTYKLGSTQGTGFVMSDGRFVTARHCVEPWMFDKKLNELYAMTLESGGSRIYAVVNAYNDRETLRLKSEDFRMDRRHDISTTITVEREGEKKEMESRLAYGTDASLGSDWACCRVRRKGAIKDGGALSAHLKSGTAVHLLGFPKGLGVADGRKMIEPIYNKLTIARSGLNSARCIMVSQGVEHGNSGGPVFVEKEGRLYVIGIVSRGDHSSGYYSHVVPMCNL